MTILIANIGTSDLAIKIKGYYLPIGFDNNEPNQDKAIAELSDSEKAVWNKRKAEIDEFFNQHITDKGKAYSFRERTRYIFQEYKPETKEDPDAWHNLLRPGRLWGVMEAAIREEQVTKVYIFVTDQPEFEGQPPQENPGYKTDSVHLFDILKRWFAREFGDKLEIIPVTIPKPISAIDQDGLLNEYYKFFNNKFDKSTTIRISVKGGTPQMVTALRVQAISSDITTQIYLEPKLSIKKLLAGQPSECQKISYWRYQRTQKYQTIKQLLNRWDFDGARTILNQWGETLTTLEKEGIEGTQDIKASENRINAIVKALNMAVGYLNLDTAEAQKQTEPSKNEVENQAIASLGQIAALPTTYQSNNFYPLLNLYTQCCLFDTLDRMADFLTRMGSFYEETLHKLINNLGGEVYFDRNRYPDDWSLDTQKLLRQNGPLAQKFYEVEQNSLGNDSTLVRQITDQNCLQNGKWQTPLGFFKLGRLTQVNFVAALVYYKNPPGNKKVIASQEMVGGMKALDYWFAKRNQLIHGAKGVSKLRMQEALNQDKQSPQNNNIRNTVFDACDANQILTQMLNITRSTLTLMGTTQPPSATGSNPADYLYPDKEPYYLYSDIRKWVIDTLNSDV